MSAEAATTRKHHTDWIKLVMEIHANHAKNCPHRAKLREVLAEASRTYCKIKDEVTDAKKNGVTVSMRSLPKYGPGKNAWVHLAKRIMRHTNCKHHHRLKDVLNAASKIYCKDGKSITKTHKSHTRKTRKAKGVLEAIGLV